MFIRHQSCDFMDSETNKRTQLCSANSKIETKQQQQENKKGLDVSYRWWQYNNQSLGLGSILHRQQMTPGDQSISGPAIYYHIAVTWEWLMVVHTIRDSSIVNIKNKLKCYLCID